MVWYEVRHCVSALFLHTLIPLVSRGWGLEVVVVGGGKGLGRGDAGYDCRRWRGGLGLADVAVVVLAVVIGVWCWRCWRSSAGAPAVAAITACGGDVSVGSGNGQCCVFLTGRMPFPEQIFVSQRSLHNAPIFRLLLKVAVNGTHQCDFPNFCGQQCPTPQLQHALAHDWTSWW